MTEGVTDAMNAAGWQAYVEHKIADDLDLVTTIYLAMEAARVPASNSPTTEEVTDAMRDAIVGAWLAGARAVHDEWAYADEVGRFFLSRDPDPDFTEAAHDYAVSNSPTTNGD